MDDISLQRELSILLCHYLKSKFPSVYKELVDHCESLNLLPQKCKTIEEALSLRYSTFPQDHFFRFISTLRANDDFPSIFRRLKPFKTEKNQKKYYLNISVRYMCHKGSILSFITDQLKRIMISGSDDGCIKIFTIPDFKYVKRLIGHRSSVVSLDTNPNCNFLLSSSYDKTIRLWSLVNGKMASMLSGFTTDIIHSAKFSPSGSVIVAACEDGTVPIWTTPDALAGKQPCRILRSPAKSPVNQIAFSPGGEFLAYASMPSNVTIVPMKFMTQTILEYHQSLVGYLSFSQTPFGNGDWCCPRLVSASSEEGAIAAWELDNGNWKTQYTVKGGAGRQKAKIVAIGTDPSQKTMLVARSTSLHIYDYVSGNPIAQFPDIPVYEDVTAIACHPIHNEIFFIGNASGDAALIDTTTMSLLHNVNLSSAGIVNAFWSTDGASLFVGDMSGSITKFDVLLEDEKRPVSTLPLFEVSEVTPKGGSDFCDRRGMPLDFEPPERVDVRDLELPVRALQSAFLHNCAAELAVVARMQDGEVEPETNPSSVDIRAPIHIPLSVDFPANPCGPNMAFVEDSMSEHEETTKLGTVVSDTDDWRFDSESSDEDAAEEVKFIPTIQSTEARFSSWPPWMTAVVYEDTSYLPQVGDEVMFIRDGYSRMLEEEGLSYPLPSDASFNTPTRVRITSLSPCDAGVQLHLVGATKELDIVFPIPESVSFLVLISRYAAAFEAAKTLKVGDKVIVPYSDESSIVPYVGDVFSIRDDFGSKPFESIAVKWEGGEVTNISPWEMYSVNGKVVDFQLRALPVQAMLVAGQVVTSYLSSHPGEPLRSLEQIPASARQRVAHPMSYTLLRERFESGWYRGEQAARLDGELLVRTAAAVYGEESPQAKMTREGFNFIFYNFDSAIKASMSRRLKLIPR